MRTCIRGRARGAALLVGLCLAAGCGGGGGGNVSVKGRVTLDGAPVEKGMVNFVPADGKGATAGAAITNGTFAGDIPAGPKKVTITSPKVIGKRKPFPDSPPVDVFGEAVPEKYNTNSQLTTDIQPGGPEVVFDLKSR